MAKIKNMHYTICLKVISSSAQVALPPAFAPLEQRGGKRVRERERAREPESRIARQRDQDKERERERERGAHIGI